jgi:predicted small integral membrane protein
LLGRKQEASEMRIIRLSKTAMVAAIALFASLVAFGNITDYGTNWAFVQHVLSMDTVDPTTTIRYRAIENPALQTGAYVLIIAAEALTAILCWIGAVRLLVASGDAAAFNRAKGVAVAGLTLGFIIWQVGFMSIGGEWFGMWMSSKWNGVPDAFRFFVTILMVLIFLVLPDQVDR